VLSEVTSESIEGEIIASLDPADLGAARRAFPIFDQFNIGLYEERLADAYLVGRPARVKPDGRL
jgi:hypothetical protein